MTTQEKIRGRKVGVIGMARSGAAAARLAKSLGATPFVSDSAPAAKLAMQTAELSALGVAFETGGHTDRLFDSEYVIISPGVSPRTPFVRALIQRGMPVFSEVEFAAWFLAGKMIAITGANGKTTTSTMVYEIMRAANIPARLVGNVGAPFSDHVMEIAPDGVAVVEVSSYQLEFIEDFRPDIGVIVNLTRDHLERHGDLRAYRDAKLRITENQGPQDTLILNIDSSELEPVSVATRATKKYFGQEETLNGRAIADLSRGVFRRGESLVTTRGGAATTIMSTRQLGTPGAHNVENAMAAATAALALGVAPESIARALTAFKGVEHRIEYVATAQGVRFVNDSKATNIDAVTKALAAIDTPIVLLMGGRGKGEDFRDLLPHMGNVRGVVALGETREEIGQALRGVTTVRPADDMSHAVALMLEMARPGDTALLSPACASFDMFDDYEHRGREYKSAVRALAEKTEALR